MTSFVLSGEIPNNLWYIIRGFLLTIIVTHSSLNIVQKETSAVSTEIMNAKLVCLLAVFCAVLLVDIDALRLRFRGRRILRRIKKPLCRAGCTYACTVATSGAAAPVCGLGCREACNRKKRTVDQIMSEAKDNQVIIPLPREFDLYDMNKDGFIEVEEFAEVLSLESVRDDVNKAFSLADVDDDGLLTVVELEEAPWLFEEDEDMNIKDLSED